MAGACLTYRRHCDSRGENAGSWQEADPKGLIGRQADLATLDQAWLDASTHLLLLHGADGIGKTALLQAWLARLEQADWGGAAQVYVWSFPDIAPHDNAGLLRLSEEFVSQALAWFGCSGRQPADLHEQVLLLCKLVQRHPTLLVLDNFPALDPVVRVNGQPQPLALLLNTLAAYNLGLCVAVTRQAIGICPTFAPHVVFHPLSPLTEQDSIALLQQQGVALPDDSLPKLARALGGYPLVLPLVAAYLNHGGGLGNVHTLFAWRAKADEGPPTRRVLAMLEQWLWHSRELLLVYLLGLLDRPAAQHDIYLLLRSQRQPWLQRWLKPDETLRALQPLSSLGLRDFARLQRRLHHLGVVVVTDGLGTLDLHPALRSYFRERVRARFPDIPARLQGLLERCTRTLQAVMPAAMPSLGGGRAERLGFVDMQAAVEATRALGVKLERTALQKHWYRAAIIANHLCEHHLILGNVSAAVYCARRSVAYAELSHDRSSLIHNMKVLNRLLRLTGERSEALRLTQRLRQVHGIGLGAAYLDRQVA